MEEGHPTSYHRPKPEVADESKRVRDWNGSGIARLKSRVQLQEKWLDKYHKYREDSVDLLNEMKSVLEKNGLWPKDGTKAK